MNEKKIAYFDSGVITPEEIIMAADMIPYRLLGKPELGVEEANKHIPPNHCVWARNLLEQALKGKLEEDIIGLITTHGCDCTNRQFDIWLETVDLDFMFLLNAPLKRNETAVNFFIEDMKELISRMESAFNVEITEEKLKKSIEMMNQIREKLKEISEYRNKMKMRESEFHELVKMAQTSEKTAVLAKANSKYEEIIQRASISSETLSKVLLTGSVIDDTEFIKFLENMGFHIVIDDLSIGTRYFWNSANEHIDPLESLANYYLSKPIYSTKYPSYDRYEFLEKLAKEYEVNGVINVAQKFCEPVLYDHPHFEQKFREAGIPYLFIEREYNVESYKQLKTRFEAFREII